MKKIWKNITDELPPYPNKGQRFTVFDGAFIYTALFHIDPETGNSWFQCVIRPAEITGVIKWAFQEDLLSLP